MFKKIIQFLALSITISRLFAQPISLHPKNPHYFLYKGQITPLITSAEHYGAVLNQDFDYIKYLDELAVHELNYTRLFVGSYVEKPGAFGIEKNTLAPAAGRFLCPWARSSQTGYYLGGNKFDLKRWDTAYFDRLKSFIQEAEKRCIVVEITFFSSLYGPEGWLASPLNSINNINQTDSLERQNVHTMYAKTVNSYQIKMLQKVVQSLNAFDNIIYEIQNEPWADNGQKVGNTTNPDYATEKWQETLEIPNKKSLEWQRLMVNTISITEQFLPKKHLIAQNFANFHQDLSKLEGGIPRKTSVYNFHYAHTRAALENMALNKVLGFDESGFAGLADSVYRRQAWRWMLAGGGLFNNLDYSFTVAKPDGTDSQKAPGGGSRALRMQLKTLKTKILSLNLAMAQPDTSSFTMQHAGQNVHALTDGNRYLVYIEKSGKNSLIAQLPEGKYTATYFAPKTGHTTKTQVLNIENNIAIKLDTGTVIEDLGIFLQKQ
jgi:hypothetical protein